jgi:hypothetical protein
MACGARASGERVVSAAGDTGPAPIGGNVATPIAAKQAQAEGIKREIAPGEHQSGPNAAAQAEESGASLPLSGESDTSIKILHERAATVTTPKAKTGAQSPPKYLRPNFELMPVELKQLKNWVLWRYLPPKSNNSKWRKVPFQPNGRPAITTDRATWSQFDVCCAAYARSEFDGVGFVFDGEIGSDGLCYCGIDFDACVRDAKVDSLALTRIKRLNAYTERSVSGTGFHCIVRAEPLDHIVKFDGVEIYTNKRFFTFTGCAFGEIKPATAAVRALVEEVRAKEAAAKQQQESDRSISNGVKLPPSFKKGPVQGFASLDPRESLAEGIKTTQWFETLSPELKNEVVDYALGVVSKNTQLLELETNGGNNAEYYKLTTSVARSGAPNAENIFVKYASGAKDADPDEALRQYFARCRATQSSVNSAVTVGTLLHTAGEHGGNFDQWKRQAPSVGSPPLPVTWSAAALNVSFSNIRHRQWLYGTTVIRGEVTVGASPGGGGKTALFLAWAIDIVAAIAGKERLGEKNYGRDLKVLYLSGEESREELRRRILAFCLLHSIAEQDLARLYVAGADDARVQSMSFLRVQERNTVLDEAGFQVLESALQSLRPDLVVIDPLVVFCGGGDMNNNTAMSLLMRKLKALAVRYDCAILLVHHTKKGGDRGDAEAVLGAATIVNLARRAIMPVPMTEEDAKAVGILPSERFPYLKLVDAKSNLAPRSAEAPWYQLNNVTLPNPELPIYPNGDGVQAISRVKLPFVSSAVAVSDDQKVKRAILDLVDRGKIINGQAYPYSPSLAGKDNDRVLLDDAMAEVTKATASRQWHAADLNAVTKRAIAKMIAESWLIKDDVKNLTAKPGPYGKRKGLGVVWAHTPWPKASAAPGTSTVQEHVPNEAENG